MEGAGGREDFQEKGRAGARLHVENRLAVNMLKVPRNLPTGGRGEVVRNEVGDQEKRADGGRWS